MNILLITVIDFGLKYYELIFFLYLQGSASIDLLLLCECVLNLRFFVCFLFWQAHVLRYYYLFYFIVF